MQFSGVLRLKSLKNCKRHASLSHRSSKTKGGSKLRGGGSGKTCGSILLRENYVPSAVMAGLACITAVHRSGEDVGKEIVVQNKWRRGIKVYN